MRQLLTTVERVPVRIVETFRSVLRCQTYHIELIFVLIILVVGALISAKGWVEWIGVFAVFLNFGHVSVADRLAESQSHKVSQGSKADIECYYKLQYYYYGKELLWLVYFIALGAWSALIGVILFLLYTPWRKLWRKYHPLETNK